MTEVFSTTLTTPDGPFSLLADSSGAVLASGWTDNLSELVALIHASIRPQFTDILHWSGEEMDTTAGEEMASATTKAIAVPTAEAKAVLEPLRAVVVDYYNGDLDAPRRTAVRQCSGEFREHAWDVLRDVTPGMPITYTEFAAGAGRPAAVRAAASACAMNAAALFVPCHRIVRSDGSLGGFRYGLEVKRSLLARESASLPGGE